MSVRRAVKIKFDENLDRRLEPLLAAAGHDIDSVLAEGLGGAKDELIYETCKSLGRALITLDLDFSNPLRFPPADTEGIIVIRPPRPLLKAIRATLMSVLFELKSDAVKGNLWIVEPGRIRIHNPDEN
ncbi:MAG: DUF5615 family PIN-like protein [Pirellulales bacterium]